MSIASDGSFEAADALVNLKRIRDNLAAGKVRAGVVGLTNSGKSTFLNAILGRQYLPSSIQSQTAKEVSIIHTSDLPGELLGSRGKSGELEHIAKGWESINSKLTELNKEVRDNNVSFQKLFLHVPITFLEETDGLKLEISDTPGLYEAAADNITYESELAVKEMSAFIMILNLRLLKTESEAAIIKALIQNHPALFAKLSRIVILVNAYDLAFLDDNPGGLRPRDVPTYVADYLRDPDIIGIEIPPEQIIPFSAKWALYARMWSADPAAFLKMENARLLYDEAVILMRRATNYESTAVPFEQANTEDIKNLCTFLLEFSHIKRIEEHLRTMLYENGLSILIEASINDSSAQILAMLENIDVKVESLNIPEKEAQLSCQEKLSVMFNDLESGQVTAVQTPALPTPEINSITETLRGTFNSKFSSIFQNHLVGFHLHQDRNAVFNRMCGAKPLLTSPANTEMQASWSSVASVVHQRVYEHAQNSFSSIKVAFLEALTSFANDNSMCGEFALQLSSKLSDKIEQIDINSLVPAFPGLPIQVDGNAISNDRLITSEQHMKLNGKLPSSERRRKVNGEEGNESDTIRAYLTSQLSFHPILLPYKMCCLLMLSTPG